MDGSNPIALAKAMLPKLPMIGKTALFHSLGVSETSKQWDLTTELLVHVLRSFISQKPETISKTQDNSKKAPPPKGNVWVSRVTLPTPPEDSLRQALFNAIESLKEPGDAPGGYAEPELLPVEAEWTGYRSDADKHTPEPHISEEEKYNCLMREATSPITILYLHGGALYLMDPATHRPVVAKLAKLTKGRCLNVRYRLAPQDPFPSAVLDTLVAYFNLLYPLPGSLHDPVAPEHIVVCGDSAGGNLSVVLARTLLEFRRQNIKIKWNGQDREVPLPAGLGLNSPWMDVTQCMPSCESNAKTDYLPPPSSRAGAPEYPPCPIWPASPPRRHVYADDAILRHPLVSPLAAQDWTGCCPIFIATGGELLTDEDKHVATVAAQQGVPVIFYEFLYMPHCFSLILRDQPYSNICFDAWSKFIIDATTDPRKIVTKGVRVTPKTLKQESIDVTALSSFTHDDIKKRMAERMKTLSEKKPDTLSNL